MTPAIFGIAGETLNADERAFFKACDPVGYILFARNCTSKDQLRALTDDLRNIHGRERLLISIDQEGGRVTRMKPPEWCGFPAGEAFDRLYQTAPASAIEAARINAKAMGAELAEMGITVDYHCPMDVRREETDNVIGDRSLGSDPVQVAALGRAVIDGLAGAGVAGCLKHMPGHGRAMADSHKELPIVEASEEELEVDIAPFRKLASTAKIGMSAHILFTAWDKEHPATQSPIVIDQIIRKAIGFDGLLLTDDIDMQALDGSIAERSVRSIEAGCDVVLNCWAKLDDMDASVNALPDLSEIGAKRLSAALDLAPARPDWDQRDEWLAKRDELLALAGQAA
jgi:beta-N-acetylhexosaminidase